MAQLRDVEGLNKRDYFMADPRVLKIMPGFNLRDMNSAATMAHIADLKEQIRGTGVLDPLEVRLVGEEVYVTHGHCRLTATLELIEEGEPIAAVPIMPEPKTVNDAERTLRQRLSNTGKPLEPLENAEMCRRLKAYGWEDQQIAARNGWTVQTVKNLLDLLALPAETQQMVKAGEVSATLAAQVTREEGEKAPETLKRAKQEAKERGKTKITRKAVDRVSKPKASTASKTALDATLDFCNVTEKLATLSAMHGGKIADIPADEQKAVLSQLDAAYAKARGVAPKSSEHKPPPVPAGMNGHANKLVSAIASKLEPFPEYCRETELTDANRGEMVNIRADYILDAAMAHQMATGGEGG